MIVSCGTDGEKMMTYMSAHLTGPVDQSLQQSAYDHAGQEEVSEEPTTERSLHFGKESSSFDTRLRTNTENLEILDMLCDLKNF